MIHLHDKMALGGLQYIRTSLEYIPQTSLVSVVDRGSQIRGRGPHVKILLTKEPLDRGSPYSSPGLFDSERDARRGDCGGGVRSWGGLCLEI